MPVVTLTDITIQNLSSEKQTNFFCSQTKNFGITVSYGGTKTFFVLVGPASKRRKITLGKYPATSLKEARKSAQRHLLDPEAARTSKSLQEAKSTYLQTYIDPNYRQRSAYNAKRLLDLTNHLDLRQLHTITSADITEILDALKPSQANHLFGVLRTFFGWCERRDYIAASPIRKLTKPHKEKNRKRTLSDAELKAIWNACEDDSFGYIVRLLLLTGQRKGEIAALESGWVADGNIAFPPRITKNGEEHTIPLSQLSRELVDIEDPNVNQLLFPSSKTGTVITGWAKLKEALDKRSAVKDWTLHDLRRTFSTKCAELGVAPHIIERCLNHLSGTISPLARRYNQHQYLAEMKQAFDTWEAYISRLISPQTES